MLGVLASLTLAATTEAHHLLAGLSRLRLPEQLVAIMGFMVRYLDVVSADLGRIVVVHRQAGLEGLRRQVVEIDGEGHDATHDDERTKALGLLV